MLNLTVGRKMLHDLSIDKEEYLNLVLWEISVIVFIVELNGGVQQGLPYVL